MLAAARTLRPFASRFCRPFAGTVAANQQPADARDDRAAVRQSIRNIKAAAAWADSVARLGEINTVMAAADIWTEDASAAARLSTERGRISCFVDSVREVELSFSDLEELMEMAHAEADAELAAELSDGFPALKDQIRRLELQCFMTGESDASGCFVHVQAGAGGVDAMEW
jgi:peptide chain release factor 2